METDIDVLWGTVDRASPRDKQGWKLTTQPSPKPGWYPDPSGASGQAYWNGREWGPPSSKPPSNNRVLIIAGSIVGGFALLGVLANLGSRDDGTSSLASTVTSTVTVTAQPPTATPPPTASTVTITQAAPAPFFQPPAPPIESPVKATPPEPELLPPVVPLVPQVPSSAYYGSCAAARAAGASPLRVGEPGYRSALDRDGDGVACE